MWRQETGATVQGSVVDWRGTFGFAKNRGKAGGLGKVFFHLNEVTNKPDRKRFLVGIHLGEREG